MLNRLSKAVIQTCSVVSSRPVAAVVQTCSVKKVFLKTSQISQENTCARVSFLINLQATEILAQVFSCEFCEIFKKTFFIEHFRRLTWSFSFDKVLNSSKPAISYQLLCVKFQYDTEHLNYCQ